jgi:RNase H-fold protein (predicted Holliday junction resolvase)
MTTDNERANTDSVKFSANQTLNSFVNQLESGRPISSYRITLQNESLSGNEAYEGLKKENQDLKKTKDELIQKLFSFEKVRWLIYLNFSIRL